MTSATKPIAIIAGAGPGLGRALAHTYAAASYPVALLARTKSKLLAIADDVNAHPSVRDSHRAKAFEADVGDEESLKRAIAEVVKVDEWKGRGVAVGIWNPGGGFKRAGLFDTTRQELEERTRTHTFGLFTFAQELMRIYESQPSLPEGIYPSLLVSGATASVRGGANFSAFAPAKFGARALSQSFAREWGPKGVHVAHIINDGLIDTPVVQSWVGTDNSDGKRMNVDSLSKIYLQLSEQERSVWTHELDVRPWAETF